MDKIPDANLRKARSEGEVVGLLRQFGGQRAYASSPVNQPLKIKLSDIFLASLKYYSRLRLPLRGHNKEPLPIAALDEYMDKFSRRSTTPAPCSRRSSRGLWDG